MALTITFPAGDAKEVSLGNLRAKIIEVTAAASDYPTGGYKPTGGWASIGMRVVYGMKRIGGNPLWAKLIEHYDSVNDKLMFMYPSGGGAAAPAALADPALAAGATPVSSAAASGSADIIPGQGKELASLTDLSGNGVLRLLVIGN
jgi:hypothetical protein